MKHFDKVVSAVASAHGLPVELISSGTRGRKDASWARQVAIYLVARVNPDQNMSAIGRAFGRDRTTVRHAIELVTKRMDDKTRKLEKQLVRTAAAL